MLISIWRIFKRCPYEHTLYTTIKDEKLVIVCLYIDDLIYTGNDHVLLENLKPLMMTEFEISDLGLMLYFLGIEVKQPSSRIFISQKIYV